VEHSNKHASLKVDAQYSHTLMLKSCGLSKCFFGVVCCVWKFTGSCEFVHDMGLCILRVR